MTTASLQSGSVKQHGIFNFTSVSPVTVAIDTNRNTLSHHIQRKDYDVCPDTTLPALPVGGARIKVCFVGACYPEADSGKKKRRITNHKVANDSSVFSGYEVSGVIHEICPTVTNTDFQCGDGVILYPDEDIGLGDGFKEYVIVQNLENLVPVPSGLSLKVAAMLPQGGLMAMAAVKKSFPFVREIRQSKGKCSILIVGAGGLGLWTMTLARYFAKLNTSDSAKAAEDVHVTVADTNTDKLVIAQKTGYDVVHWCQAAHEQYLVERTRNVCGGGVDVVIDFVSTPRTVMRSMAVLNKGGVLLVGNLGGSPTSLRLLGLSENEQAVVGFKRGTRADLADLVSIVADGQVTVPHCVTYPVQQAERVFTDLYECRITGRAVLQVSETEL